MQVILVDKKELVKILKDQGYDAVAEEVAEQVADNFRQASSEVISVLCRHLTYNGELIPSDATKISNIAKRRDLGEIERILANASNKSIEEIDSLLKVLAEENDNLSLALFKYNNKTPTSYTDDEELKAILETSAKSMKEGMINISNTSALRVDMNNNLVTMDKAYVRAINQSIFATQQGYTDYYTAIRAVVLKMSADGVKKIVLGSGKAVRLDSQARMNVLEGVRMFNQEYRRKQGEQFGADGVEISAHFPCAPDHLPYQGRQFSNKDFDELQESLPRPIGKMNCTHSIAPIILGISKPVYSDEELEQAREMSEREIEYTDSLGRKRTTTGYGATQVQRYKELQVRKLKDQQRALENVGDTVGAKEIKKKVTKAKKEYYRVCEEMGVPPRSNRLDYVKSMGPMKLKKNDGNDIINSGARILDPDGEEGKKFAKMYYKEIMSFSTDCKNIAKNISKKQEEIEDIKEYLFNNDKFKPDCAIAQSWQRLMQGKDIKQHDYTLIEHELYEMKLKKENPDITHQEAHKKASERFNYQKEVSEYYGGLNKYKKK